MIMKVKYEQIQGMPLNLRKMPLTVVQQLKEGDKVFIWWAKDGNLRDVRVNETCIVEKATIGTTRRGVREGIDLSVAGGDIHILDEDVAAYPNSNQVNWASRGDVFFYFPPED